MRIYLVWYRGDPCKGEVVYAATRGKAKSAFLKKHGFYSYLKIRAVVLK